MKVINKNIEIKKENTQFEKYEMKIKEGLFNLIYVLLKLQNDQIWIQIIIIIIEALQLLSFPFSLRVRNNNNQYDNVTSLLLLGKIILHLFY